jgi:hypothetical protein
MKPVLLLNIGTAFSATTPLFYTLALDNKYFHTGHLKANGYLYGLYAKEEKLPIFKILEDQFEKRGENIRKKRNNKHKPKKLHRPLELTKWSEYVKFNGEDFFSKNLTLQKYIDYYLEHYNYIKDDYVGVADFSNNNANLPEKFIRKISAKLLENFDVKVTMICRDPVRRLFSVANKVSQDIGHRDPVNMIKKWVNGQMEENVYYSNLYKNWSNVFGKEKVHMIVMEEFSAGKNQSLIDFLGFPIEKVHKNVYYPDMGVNAPHYEYLADQWRSDIVSLDDDLYKYLFERMSFVYDEFEKIFGYIPDAWMK